VTLGEDCSLSLEDGTMIDLGAVAKGYTGDLLCEALEKRGVRAAIVNLGGNVQTYGKKPDGSRWKIGIASPDGEGSACTVMTNGAAIVTSGAYERYFEKDGRRYCHIIDPSNGRPVDGDLLSVTVIGENGFECDALSTAMFVLGKDGAISYWREHGGFEMILITEKGVSATSGIASDVELCGAYAKTELTVVE
jgi:thiamine biosynthesis lipoprotein